MKRIITLAAVALLLSACAISQHVVPVQSNTEIDTIYVLFNDRVRMEGMNDELIEQFQALGFAAELYHNSPPSDALHTFTYTANWHWDMAMYLTYFRGTLYEDGRVLGEIEYDARSGGSNMRKFGRSGTKIEPLLAEMLNNVRRN
jgi:hypothetical protein